MNHYEILLIISGEIPEENQEKILISARECLTKEGGIITLEENLDKKRLAYPIKKIKVGFYKVFEFDLEGAKIKEIEKSLKLINEILRFIVVQKDKTEKKIEVKKSSAVPVFKQVIPTSEEKEETKKTGEKTEEKAEKRGKVSIEELDAKLDEILHDDIGEK